MSDYIWDDDEYGIDDLEEILAFTKKRLEDDEKEYQTLKRKLWRLKYEQKSN